MRAHRGAVERRRLASAVAALAGAAGFSLAAAPPGLERGDPASRIGPGDSATEFWDLVAVLDSGHRVLARVLITNEGPGEGTAVATGYLVHPDGSTTPFKNGRRSGRWNLEAEGRRIDIGSSVLDLSGPAPSFVVDNDKRGIKLRLDFELRGAAAWPDSPSAPAYAVDLLDTSAPVQGRLWVRGMAQAVESRGRLGLTHTWTPVGEAELAQRRIDFFSLDPGEGLYLRDVTAPGGGRSRFLALQRGGRTVLQAEDFELAFGAPPGAVPAGNDEPGYPVPALLSVRGPNWEGEIRLGPVLMSDDPLEVIPQPFRFLLSLKTRPRRIWVASPYRFELSLPAEAKISGTETATDAAPLRIRGTGVTTVTFANPMRATTAFENLLPGTDSCKSLC